MRWFMIGDGRAGLRDDDDGFPVGLEKHFFADADAALDLLAEARLRAVFVLVDFLWFRRARRLRGVRMHGRGGAVRDPGRRQRLLDGVFRPIFERYGREPVIQAWDVINEPEWATFGVGGWRRTAVAPRTMRAFIGETVALLHATTGQAATVGCAGGRSLRLVEGLGLDFYQVHWYDAATTRFSLERPVGARGLDRPCVLGEFPTRGSRLDAAAIVAKARRSGYAGAWAWSVLADDRATDRAACEGLWRRAPV